MINTRVQSKQDYIKELKQQIDSRPSKLDQYKQKLSEREMYEKDNMFDYFGRAGGGAPLRNEDGRVKTTRRTMLNDNYEELTMNNNQNKENNNNYNNYYNDLQEQYKQQIQQQMMNNAQNMNQQMIPQQMMQPQMNMLPYQETNMNYQQSSLYNTQRNLTPYQQIQQYNQMNNGAPVPNNTLINTPSYLQQEMNNTNYHIQNSINNISSNNNYRNVQSARTPLVSPNINNDINFNEVKIIPIEHQKNVDKLEVQKKMLRDDWIKQIEDKKQRLKEEKQKQIEKDRIEEMKYQKYLEEQKEAEKAQKYQNDQLNQSPMSPQSNSQSNLNQPQSHTPLSLSNRANYSNQDNKSNSNSGLNQSFGILRNNSANNLTSNMISNIQPPMLNYATISRNLDDTINDQIAKLRNDVSLQYVEMSNLFNKLKMDVAEANQLKGEAERELKYIRDELLKTKMNNILYENKLNQVLERNAPYNNLHIPFSEVDPFNGAHNRIQSGKNLQSTSSMVFANDMVNEGNINRVRELSSLAQVGQSLVGESEFIPIQTTNEDLSPTINAKSDVNNSNENSTKILDDYMKKGDYQDMYKKLVDIANINHQMNPEAKVRTIGKNLEVDYDAINSKQGQKEEIKKLDDMLKDIVEKSNKYS